MNAVFDVESEAAPDQKDLSYKPEIREKRKVGPFAATVLSANLENGEWHVHGVCGRDENGLPTLPEGYVWNDVDVLDHTSPRKEGKTVRRREASKAEIDELHGRGLIPPEVNWCYMFFNPDEEELEDTRRWR